MLNESLKHTMSQNKNKLVVRVKNNIFMIHLYRKFCIKLDSKLLIKRRNHFPNLNFTIVQKKK